MPGLLRGMARTAVVAGTATSVSNRVSRRQARRWAEQDPARLRGGSRPLRPRPRRPRSHRPAQGARRAAPAGRPDRRGVRRSEGEAARPEPSRRGPRAGSPQLARVVVVWVITAAALMLLSALLAGFDVEDFGAALASAAAIGLINALVWPLVIRVALPLTVLTLGLGVLVLNGAVVWAVSELEPGMAVDAHRRRRRGGARPHRGQHRGHLAARHRRRRLLVPQRGQAPRPAPAGRRAT